MLYGNYCYIFIENFPQKFSPCTIISTPIVGQQLAQYILTDHQDADCRPMIRLILPRQLQACLHRADVTANIVSPIIGLLAMDRCLGYYRSTNLRFIKARPILSLSFIYRPLIFDIPALVQPSFIDRSLLPQYQTDNQATLDQLIFNLLKFRPIPILFSFPIFIFCLLTFDSRLLVCNF